MKFGPVFPADFRTGLWYKAIGLLGVVTAVAITRNWWASPAIRSDALKQERDATEPFSPATVSAAAPLAPLPPQAAGVDPHAFKPGAVEAPVGASARREGGVPIGTVDREFLRQQEREQWRRRQQERRPDIRLPRPMEKSPPPRTAVETPCFVIDTVRLKGEAAERFEWALTSVEGRLGRCLGAQGINGLTKAVQNAIIGRGYTTTRVLVEPQDVKTGVLTLTLIPGRIRAIRFSEPAPLRASLWNAFPARPGDLLDLRDLEQGLENLERLPTVDADIQIAPGDRPGESDLLVSWKQRTSTRWTVSVDDSGSQATGRYQGALTLSGDNWLALNDLFYFTYSRNLEGGDDHGTRANTAHYSLPFGYWSLGLTYTDYRYYQAVAGAYQTYTYSGTSENSDLQLSRLVYRDAVRKTTVSFGGYARRSRNFIDDTEVEVQRRRVAGWEFGLSHVEFVGQSTLSAHIGYRRGTGAFHALPAPEELFDEGTSRPRIITANASLNVPFAGSGHKWRYLGHWRGQWEDDTRLVPNDRFAIGSRFTVRGFDGELSLSGDRGWVWRNDVGLFLEPGGQELYLGVDYGEVGGPSTEDLLGTRLAGAVLGVRGGYKRLRYELFVGRPVSRPENFETADTSVGFSLIWQS